jgi:O-succinylbenzoate synthase
MAYKIRITDKILHFKQPAGTSRGVYTTRHSYYLHIANDTRHGVEGVGECATLPDLSCDAVPEYEQILREACKAFEITGKIDYEALRPYPSILFGLESALAMLEADGSERLFDTPFARGE